jgi:intein-encoded DNA endonuclease-like protein
MTKAYLLGALHDATERKTTYRISQKNKEYVKFIAKGIKALGKKAWIYKEGQNRNVYVVEFSKSLLRGFKIQTRRQKVDYIRGYFDTEGGITKSKRVRYYIYFAQKDRKDLEEVKSYLEELKISCGKIHNPSKMVDPDYFRFYVLSSSWNDFAFKIRSFHPDKIKCFRMKI